MTDPIAVKVAAVPSMSGVEGLTVALAQITPTLGNVPANVAQHVSVIARAKETGADLVVFPELSLTGYFLEDLVPDVALRVDAEELRPIAEHSQEIDVVVGCVIVSDDARFYDAMLYFSKGELKHVHRKVYLPTYGLFDESRYLASGNTFRAFPVSCGGVTWRAGILLCEDMWHPSAAVNLAQQGVELFICPSASPGRGVNQGRTLGTAQGYDAMTKTYGQLFTSYVVYCNRVGYEDGVGFWGGSRVVAPDGGVLIEAPERDETLVVCRLSYEYLKNVRFALPLLRDERHDLDGGA